MGKEEALQLIKRAAETGATRLDLGRQGLTELPPELFEITNLTALDLRVNRLTSLPPEIVQLTNLKELYLYDNPLTSPPYELAVQGIEAIREYFTSLEEGGQPLAEVKIILMGEGASGKTSLIRCLRGERFDPHEATTHGIRIKDWQLDIGSQHVRCKLWDFGGQEIMHATHQFFLSRCSLYVLVLDGRRDERPEYWLRYIESFGGGSPVLVVLNKQDINPGFDLNRPFLQEKYPFIKGFWPLSCHSGQGMAEFTRALHEALSNVPMTKNRWPASWFWAKEKLEQLHEPRINYERFEHICLEAGVKGATTRQVLVDFLNDLGTVIHFDEFALQDHHVLDPKWVTEAVYAIINAPALAESKGLLKLRDLREILRFKEGDSYHYEHNDYSYLVGLMKKFELCYELDDERVLIPQLLGVSEPAFEFDYSKALRFELRYEDFLPHSVLPRFIVKLHEEIKDDLQWRSGVVLENALLDVRAVVRADNESRRLHIAVTGTQRKAYLTVIMLSLREINSCFAGLKVSERVPMPDEPERTADYETLLNYAEQGIEKYIPEGSKKAYKVSELLDTVDEEKMLKILQKIKGDMPDKAAFLDVIGKNLKIEPELFGFGINLKQLAREIVTLKIERTIGDGINVMLYSAGVALVAGSLAGLLLSNSEIGFYVGISCGSTWFLQKKLFSKRKDTK
jgi:small GTP-binding protein